MLPAEQGRISRLLSHTAMYSLPAVDSTTSSRTDFSATCRSCQIILPPRCAVVYLYDQQNSSHLGGCCSIHPTRHTEQGIRNEPARTAHTSLHFTAADKKSAQRQAQTTTPTWIEKKHLLPFTRSAPHERTVFISAAGKGSKKTHATKLEDNFTAC